MGDPADPIDELALRRREERRAVDEAGGGASEGFELAEQELIEHTSHGDEHTPSRIMRDAAGQEEDDAELVYGEADEEHKPD
jgi:protease II